MAGNVYAIADTHFFHAKAATWRGFDSVEDHDDSIMEGIIGVVHSRDTLIIAGDLIFGTTERFDALIEKWIPKKWPDWVKGTPLPFTLKVVPGNHDRPARLKSQYINAVVGYGEYKINGQRVVISHVPIHPECLTRWDINVHGHLHFNSLLDPLYVNVSYEQCLKPVLLTSVVPVRRERQRKGIFKWLKQLLG